MDEFGIRSLCPTPRRLILLAGKDAHGHGNVDALGVEKAAFVFPIETRRRDPGVRQPIKRDVVENLVTREFAGGARRPVQSRDDRLRRLAVSIIVVEKPGGQSYRRIRNAVQGLWARGHVLGVINLLDCSDKLLIGASFLGREIGWRWAAGPQSLVDVSWNG